MCSPSTLRRAQLSRCVAVWLRMVSARSPLTSSVARLADLDRAFRDPADVQHGFAELLRVLDLEGAGRRGDGALVADLAALLGVEVGAVEQQGGLVAGVELARVTTRLSLTQPRTLALAVRPPYLGESSVFGSSPLTAVMTSFLRPWPRLSSWRLRSHLLR